MTASRFVVRDILSELLEIRAATVQRASTSPSGAVNSHGVLEDVRKLRTSMAIGRQINVQAVLQPLDDAITRLQSILERLSTQGGHAERAELSAVFNTLERELLALDGTWGDLQEARQDAADWRSRLPLDLMRLVAQYAITDLTATRTTSLRLGDRQGSRTVLGVSRAHNALWLMDQYDCPMRYDLRDGTVVISNLRVHSSDVQMSPTDGTLWVEYRGAFYQLSASGQRRVADRPDAYDKRGFPTPPSRLMITPQGGVLTLQRDGNVLWLSSDARGAEGRPTLGFFTHVDSDVSGVDVVATDERHRVWVIQPESDRETLSVTVYAGGSVLHHHRHALGKHTLTFVSATPVPGLSVLVLAYDDYNQRHMLFRFGQFGARMQRFTVLHRTPEKLAIDTSAFTVVGIDAPRRTFSQNDGVLVEYALPAARQRAVRAELVGAPRRDRERDRGDTALEPAARDESAVAALEMLRTTIAKLRESVRDLQREYAADSSLEHALATLHTTHRRLPHLIQAPLSDAQRQQAVENAVKRTDDELAALEAKVGRDLTTLQTIGTDLAFYRYRELRAIMRSLSDAVLLGAAFNVADFAPQYTQIANVSYDSVATAALGAIRAEFLVYSSYRGEFTAALATQTTARRLVRLQLSRDGASLSEKHRSGGVTGLRAVRLDLLDDWLVVLTGADGGAEAPAWRVEARDWNTLERVAMPVTLPERGAATLMHDEHGRVLVYLNGRWYSANFYTGVASLVGELRAALRTDNDDEQPRPLAIGDGVDYQAVALSVPQNSAQTALLVARNTSFDSLAALVGGEAPLPETWGVRIEGQLIAAVLTRRGALSRRTLAVLYQNAQGESHMQLFDADSGKPTGGSRQRDRQSGADYQQLLLQRHADGLTLNVVLREPVAQRLVVGRVMI